MSESENERVVLEFFEALDRGDVDTIMEHFADDSTVILATMQKFDKEGLRKVLARWFVTFPDYKTHIDRMISQGNTVVAEYTYTMTHTGEYLGIPATNKKIEVPSVCIFDFEAGKVKLWKNYYNARRVERFLRE